MPKAMENKLDISLLYAEDEELSRRVLCEVLSTRVRTVHQAANGREGLDMFRQYRPDVVLIDNNMPGIDGIALAGAIQSIEPATRIIIISGDIDRKDLVQMESMQLHYIKKPVRILELLDLLKRLEKGLDFPPDLAARAHPVMQR